MAKMVVTDQGGHLHEVEGRVGLKIMETLREFDYGVTAICGGLCSCATCHVLVEPDWMSRLPPPQSDEKDLLVELQSTTRPFAPELPGGFHRGARRTAAAGGAGRVIAPRT